MSNSCYSKFYAVTAVLGCLLVLMWGVYEIMSPVDVDAATGNRFKIVYDQKDNWGYTRILVDTDTRIGYMVMADTQGRATGMTQLTDVLGHPQRYRDDGSVVPRLKDEAWIVLEYCDVPWHPQGAEHFHILPHYGSTHTDQSGN